VALLIAEDDGVVDLRAKLLINPDAGENRVGGLQHQQEQKSEHFMFSMPLHRGAVQEV
jgi:hypothetical protein